MSILYLVFTGAAALVGFVTARNYVRTRLRYVDAVQKPLAPLLFGGVCALLAAPVVWLLPIVTLSTAIFFGVSVGVGVAAGAKDIRRGNAGLIEP